MRITDEQIMQVAEAYIRNVSDLFVSENAIPNIGSIEEFARDVITLAQQVKPLEWHRRDTGWYASTPFGTYFLDEIDFDYNVKLVETPTGSTEIVGRRINGMDDAKEVAQQDYQRRIWECLAFGGV